MAGRPPRLQCFACNSLFNARQLARLDGNENILKRQIVIARCVDLRHQPLALNENSRLCLNCNISIVNEINAMNADSDCLRLNVFIQSANQTCLFCNAVVGFAQIVSLLPGRCFYKKKYFHTIRRQIMPTSFR